MEAALSPELALVCPDLRAAALAALPERDPDGWEPPAWVEPIRREPFLAGVRATISTGLLALVLVAIATHLLTWAADGPSPRLLEPPPPALGEVAPPANAVLGERVVLPESDIKPLVAP